MKQEIPRTPPRRPPPQLPKSSSTISAVPMTVCASGTTPTSNSHSKTPSRMRVSPKSNSGSPKIPPEKPSSGRITAGATSPGSDQTRTRIVRTTTTQKIITRKPPVPLQNNDIQCRIPNRDHGIDQRRRPSKEGIGSGSRVVKENAGKIDTEKEELRRKVVELESIVTGLKEEVMGMKSELEITRQLNVDLQAENVKFSEDLANAEAKIETLMTLKSDQSSEMTGCTQDYIASKSEENTKFIVEHPQVDKRVLTKQQEATPPTTQKTGQPQHKTPASSQCPSPPPPPPPPPPTPPRLPLRANVPRKPPPLVEFYQTLTKREGNKSVVAGHHMNQYRPAASNAHNSIVGEIENRSSHLLAIKTDIESKGEFINDLINRVVTAGYSDIEDLSLFISWLDSQLSTLADERAVLKHFQWPERKADAMREAAIEYRCLKSLEYEISSYSDDISIPCGVALKKITNLLDKLDRGIQGMVKLRNLVMHSYQSYKIPFDWMLDSGLVGQIKRTSKKLAKLYLKRVITEVQSLQNSDKESTQETLLLQGMHFAYKIYQFAGELDSETMCAFEEIRQRVPQNQTGGGSAAVLVASLPSS